ncbi:MAG: hypothetical protein A2086_14740 [Spirochaetes bacterium GWD1_27_9]|nr:MAG: hypothetical protein A2Z98_10020 [Spirochaetes bacterium GWB1_27_13]OHD21094.1 MAG: hypothetical protein A2Y34_06280 [Spirochaetes bacterium GWC1_27_15]OHD34753.1 MAG: hypothetical protein A2086_14740 [Spirochaetes bacterium GWD1_27_9]
MIIDKFFNYKINAYTISAQIIEIMRKRKKMNINALFNEIAINNTDMNQDTLFESLGLLFLTGKIDYNLETDNMELKNEIS